MGRNRIEQDAEADLLAVMLFAYVRFNLNKKGLKKSEKSRQLAQAA